jgi:hypothetical protein
MTSTFGELSSRSEARPSSLPSSLLLLLLEPSSPESLESPSVVDSSGGRSDIFTIFFLVQLKEIEKQM